MANPRTIARVAARIQQRVAYCLQFELNDPRASFVTITKVELSSDMRHAKLYWSTLEQGGRRQRIQGMLEHASGYVRRQLGRVLETRVLPELRWVFDESIERAAAMERLIREARQRDAAIRGEPPHGEPNPATRDPSAGAAAATTEGEAAEVVPPDRPLSGSL